MKKIVIIIILMVLIPSFASGTDVGGIISSDTTWNLADSPYTIVSNIELAEGVTLTIEPGVVVNTNGSYNIFVYGGNLIIIGTGTQKISFIGVDLHAKAAGYEINIQHAIIKGDGLFDGMYAPDGELILKNCYLENTDESNYCHLGDFPYDFQIEKNIFVNCDLGSYCSYADTGEDNYIKNNVFSESQIAIPYSEPCATIFEHNTILNCFAYYTACYECLSGETKQIPNNYWGTTDTSVIDDMIYDKNDSLSCDGYINYLPILIKPHADTPRFKNATPFIHLLLLN